MKIRQFFTGVILTGIASIAVADLEAWTDYESTNVKLLQLVRMELRRSVGTFWSLLVLILCEHQSFTPICETSTLSSLLLYCARI